MVIYEYRRVLLGAVEQQVSDGVQRHLGQTQGVQVHHLAAAQGAADALVHSTGEERGEYSSKSGSSADM